MCNYASMTSEDESKSMSKKIIIVGGGIAGLAACKELTKYGFDVLILEARNHPGGRASPNVNLGIPLGTGASWIHGADNNPIASINKSSTNMVPVNPENFFIWDEDGRPIPSSLISEFNIKFDSFLKKAKEIADGSQDIISLAQALANVIKFEDFTSVELTLFKSKLKYFEGYIGDNYEFLSAQHWNDEEPWPGDNCYLLSTYQPIIEALSKNCRIEFNSIVTEINIHKDNIEVKTKDRVYHANAVIVTLPLGVLKNNSVIFNPRLPINKQNAIQNLGMGLFNITAIKFPFSFWPNESHAMFFTQFDDSSIATFFNLHHFIKEPILLGYSGGETARKLENYSDIEIIDKVMRNFKIVFGENLPAPVNYFNTRWSRDPFARGSYSYYKTGSSQADRLALAEPVLNKLFFAGEATSLKHPATTHGAYLSGLREAGKVKKIYFAS